MGTKAKRSQTIFWEEETLWGVTVGTGDCGITVGGMLVFIIVRETMDITSQWVVHW